MAITLPLGLGQDSTHQLLRHLSRWLIAFQGITLNTAQSATRPTAEARAQLLVLPYIRFPEQHPEENALIHEKPLIQEYIGQARASPAT
jgi:hypothetical protein